MKKQLLCWFLLAFTVSTRAQITDFYGKPVATTLCKNFKDNKEAKAVFDKICNAASVPNNFVVLPCPGTDNCQAIVSDGIPYILYDNDFLAKLQSFNFTQKELPGVNANWDELMILCHELSHHLCQHLTNKLLSQIDTPVQLELQADEFGASIMYRLGASLPQAQHVMRTDLVPTEATFTHPGRQARLDAIAKGWNAEKAKHPDPVVVITPTPTPIITKKQEEPVVVADNALTTADETDYTMQRGTKYPVMVKVEGGTFTMGSNDADANDWEKPTHQVTVSSFYIGKYEVTQAQWQAVMGSNPSNITGCPNCPVENVSWNDAQAYVQKLSEQTGKRYRLPTEAEWEYAAKGGHRSHGYKFAGSNKPDDVAWYDGNGTHKTHAVGKVVKPNELGIYDLSGNVLEWCYDWYGPYSTGSQTDPRGPDAGTYRVVRGGSWGHNARNCRVTKRFSITPTISNYFFGFRVVCVPE